MNAMLCFMLCVACAAAATIPLSSPITHYALLDGDQQTPPITTAFRGIAIFSLSSANVQFTLIHDVPDSIISAVHIHYDAFPGETSNTVTTLAATGKSPVTGTVAVTSSEAALLSAGRAYVNVHSNPNPAGEIRGQILVVGQAVVVAQGKNQLPVPVNTTAFGAALFTINSTGLKWRVSHNAPNPIYSHLHGPGTETTTSAPVEVTLSPDNVTSVSPISGSISNFANIADFKNSRQYLNIHTEAYPGGELRGQLKWGNVLYAVGLDGSQAGTPSTAIGAALISISSDASSIDAYVQATGLNTSITAIHIHGPSGIGGTANPVATLTTGNPSVTLNVAFAAFANLLESGQAYFNIHTLAYQTNGEIRGQIGPIGVAIAPATTTGSVGTTVSPLMALIAVVMLALLF